MSELLNGDTDDSSRTWDDKTKGFVFTGVNMSFAWVRVKREGLKTYLCPRT